MSSRTAKPVLTAEATGAFANTKFGNPATMPKKLRKNEIDVTSSASSAILTPLFTPTIEAANDSAGRSNTSAIGESNAGGIPFPSYRSKLTKPTKGLMSKALCTVEDKIEATMDEVGAIKLDMLGLTAQLYQVQTMQAIADIWLEEKLRELKAGPMGKKVSSKKVSSKEGTVLKTTASAAKKEDGVKFFDRSGVPLKLAGVVAFAAWVGSTEGMEVYGVVLTVGLAAVVLSILVSEEMAVHEKKQ